MKKLVLFLIYGLIALPGVRLNAQDVSFKVSAPPAVVMGANFQIAYEVNKLNCTDFRVPPEFSDHFDVLFGPAPSESTSVSIMNGRMTRNESMTYTFTLRAKKEGTVELGPATVRIGNSEYKSDPLTLKVLPPDQAAQTQPQGRGGQQQSGESATSPSGSTRDIFMRIIPSSRNVYEQEGFLVTFKLYWPMDANVTNFLNPKFPEFEGFLAPEIELKEFQSELEQYLGRNYHTVVVKQTVLYPQRSGQLTIGSGKIELDLLVRTQVRSRSIFDDFFNTHQKATREAESPPLTINVKPLPGGKPANFSNAVGNFSMVWNINKTQLKANEAVTIKLSIKGNGNIRLIKTPEIKFPNDFEVYDPKVDNSNIRITTSGTSGTKTIEYMAIPRYAGDFEIPPVSFSYFDPQAGAYKTITTEPFKLHVEKDENSSDAAVVSNFTTRENVRFLGKDIRYLKTTNIHFRAYKDIFFGSFLYIMAYLMMTILFVVFFIIYRKQVKENANIALVRTKKANKTAVRRLKQAEKLLHDHKDEAFYEEVLRALWGYLSDKLNLPQSELTKDNVANELAKAGVDDVLSAECLEIIHTCEFARYAPQKAEGAMDQLFSEAIHAISQLENTIKK